MTALRIRVYADEPRLIRESLEALLTREGLEAGVEGRPPAGFAERLAAERPDVVVFDMPPGAAIPSAIALRSACPQMPSILVTASARESDVLEALRAGIRGYVLKSRPASDFVRTIRDVAAGATVLPPELLAGTPRPEPVRWRDPLTPRAAEVLRLLADGRTTKEIARELGLSVKTAEAHRTRIMERLAIHHTAGLVRYAIRRGLIEA